MGELLMQRFPDEPKPEWPADIISGLAGIILVQLWAARNGIDNTLDRAHRYGRRLASMAQRSASGSSWVSAASAHVNLVGYSHGTSGIAAALFSLLEHFDDPILLAAAEGALAYDNAHFSAERQNWADFREAKTEDEPEFMNGWCHGAPGIAVSRLRMQNPPADLWVALKETLRSVQAGHNFCLCHGVCGNADVLLSAHERFPNVEYLQAAHAVADRALEFFHRPERPWNCGIEEHEDAPQLMTGVAGIGYFLLRCANPGVPSVLAI
jgi:lantibiotic modifying enzyme